MVFPLFKRWSSTALGIVSTRKTSKSGSYRLDDLTESSGIKRKNLTDHVRGDRKKKRVVHPLSIPNETAWGSDEAIVKEEGKGAGEERREVEQEARKNDSVGAGVRRSHTVKKEVEDLAHGDILMTREWQLSERYESRKRDEIY